MESLISYEVHKFNPKPSTELVCPICYCVMHDAHMCPCHHIFCGACIRKWLDSSFTCPSCRRAVNPQQLQQAPPLVLNVLSSLTMDCDYKAQGCEQCIPKEKFPSHIADCDFRPVPCPHKGCYVKTVARELSSHTKECRFRSLKCPDRCQQWLPAFKLENHDCFRMLWDKVQELDGLLYRYQMVLTWIRKKLNSVRLQSPLMQLRGYEEMIASINQYWGQDQPFPQQLCGEYVAPPSHVTGSVEENESLSAIATLERLVAEASGEAERTRTVDQRDPGGTDGPTVHTGWTQPVRPEIDFTETLARLQALQRRSGTWNTLAAPPARNDLNRVENNAVHNFYFEDRYFPPAHQSPDTSRATRERGHGGVTQEQNRNDANEATHSAEESHSAFDEDLSYQTVDSSGQFSSISGQEDYSSTSQSSTAYSHQRQSSSSYGNTEYNQHHQDDDHAYPDWHGYSLVSPDYGSGQAESRRYSRSRSRSPSLNDGERRDRHNRSRSYSPTEHDTISRSLSGSCSPGRSYDHSPSRSSMNSGHHSQSQSRSPSGNSSSRSTSHHQGESPNQGCSSSRTCSSNNRTPEAQFSDPSPWGGERSDDNVNDEPTEDQGSWTPVWEIDDTRDSNSDHWSDEGYLEEVLDECESPVRSASQIREPRRQAETTDNYPYNDFSSPANFSEDSVETVLPNRNLMPLSSEQDSVNYHSTSDYAYRESSDRLQKTGLNSDISNDVVQNKNRASSNLLEDNFSENNHVEEQTAACAHTLETPSHQDSEAEDSPLPSIRRLQPQEEDTTASRTTESRHGNSFTEGGREALQCPTAGCSYTQNKNSGTEDKKKSETDHIGLAKDGPHLQEKGGMTLGLEGSRNVWESSSDTTSLDYDIPADDSSPGLLCQPESDSDREHHSPTIDVEQFGDTGNAADNGRTCDKNDRRRRKSSADDDGGKFLPFDRSDENVPDKRTKKQTGARGKGLKRKRENSTPIPDCDNSSDEGSDTEVSVKKKLKVRSTDSRVPAGETNIQVNPREGENRHEDYRQSSLPSTSQSSPQPGDVTGDRERKHRSHKKEFASSHRKAGHDLKIKLKKRKLKRGRDESSLGHKENAAALPNRSVNVEHPVNSVSDNHQASNPSAQTKSPVVPATGNETSSWGGWAANHPKRNSKSCASFRHELPERTSNRTESGNLNVETVRNVERRFSLRPAETEGRRVSERRVIESDTTRQVEDDSGHRGVSECLNRGSTQMHTSGRRITRIENTFGRMETRRHPVEENPRTVLITDLPVPPTTLDLLNRYDDSDESDSTWSPSSSRTESSGTV